MEVVRQEFKEIHRQKKQIFHKRLRDLLSIKVAMKALAEGVTCGRRRSPTREAAMAGFAKSWQR
jgi:hypothetical protein